MDPRRRAHRFAVPRAVRGDELAVTPIIGTIFILAITVVGMGVVLLMGTPVIQNLQDQAGLRTMEGQLNQVRHAVQTLTIPGASKAPGITLPGGSASITSGDTFLVSAALSGNCDLHLESWTDADTVVYLAAPVGCMPTTQTIGTCILNTPCFSAYPVASATGIVSTTNAVSAFVVGGATGSCHPVATVCARVTLSQALGTSDWDFKLTDGTTSTMYADAWLLHTQSILWRSANARADATFENGALFATSGQTQFLESDPFWSEAATGDNALSATAKDQFLMRFSALSGNPSGSISGTDGHTLLVGLTDSSVRASATSGVTQVRIDVAGTLAGQWCNGILLRNGLQTLPTYTTTGRQFSYAPDSAFPCSTGDSTSRVRSVTYHSSNTADDFAFQLIHARLGASFQL